MGPAVVRVMGMCALLALLGCSPRPRTTLADNHTVLAQTPPKDRILRFASTSAELLDPAQVADTAGHHLMMNVFEGLYVYNRGDGPAVPAMAQSRDVSADGLTWTFHLRTNLRWSDGTPLTAEDFAWSWLRVLEPKTASRSAQLLWFVKGAQALNSGEDPNPQHVGISVLDPLTLRVQLTNPTPFFEALLCEMPYVPTPRHLVQRWGAAWVEPGHIASNGPFVLSAYQDRKHAILKRNPTYWDAPSVWLDGIEILLTDSDQTAFDWYEVGRTQWHGDTALPMDKLPALRASGRVDLRTDPKLCSYYFSLRVDRPPLDDPRIRQAINLAIDKERLAVHVLRGGQPIASGAVPALFSNSHGYQSPAGDGYDPERARQLLAEAGHPHGLGLPPIRFSFNTGEGHRVIAEFVQRNLQENLGIRLELINMEWGSLLKALQAGDFAIGRSSWCADYPDPLTFLEVFHSQSKANYSGYRNATYDARIAAIAAEVDTQKRNTLITLAEQQLNTDLPMLPVYHYTWNYLVKPYVLGYERHMQDAHPLKYIRFADAQELAQIQGGAQLHLPALTVPSARPASQSPSAESL